jgi:4-hydroxybenzoate polyprenyltransferase
MVKSDWTQGKRKLDFILGLVKSLRPRQWLKNLALFANLVFSGQLLEIDKFLTVIVAFGLFCLISSSMYLVNDVVDAPRDLLHPFKSKRPIAAGVIGRKTALFIALILASSALFVGFGLNPFFGATILAFIILQISYSFWLKHFILIDVMAIAAGFLLRVYSGALVIDGHVTVWFILAVTSVALFLAIGKRRSERTFYITRRVYLML